MLTAISMIEIIKNILAKGFIRGTTLGLQLF
jgi:hypothetical protein